MSTSSSIAVKTETNVKSVYCHWDGYIDGVGKTLFEHYDYNKTLELIELGNISGLGPEIGEKHTFCANLSKDSEEYNWTTFYGRDGGDTKNITARMFDTVEEWLLSVKKYCDYLYLLDNGSWLVWNRRTNKFNVLTDNMIKKVK